MAIYSKKCIDFVKNLSITKIAFILESGKTIAEREKTLKAMSIPKSYLGYIVESFEYYYSKDERKAEVHEERVKIRKKRAKRYAISQELAEISIATIDKIKAKRDKETFNNFKYGFEAMLSNNLRPQWNFKFSENFNYRHDKNFIKWTTNFPIYENVINIDIPENWRENVLKRGLKFIRGMFTADLRLIETRENVKIYSAQWVRGARGYNVNIHKGLIAIDKVGNNYHLDCDDINETTIERVLECLRYRIEHKRDLIEDELNAEKRKRDKEILSKFMEFKQELISFEMARKAGACHSGIMAWLNENNLIDSYNISSDFAITLERFAKAYQKVKQTQCLTVFKFWGKTKGFNESDCNSQVLAKLAK